MATINYIKDINIRGWDGSGYTPIEIDKATRAQSTIDYAHHEIHGGSSFMLHQVYSGVASGFKGDLLFVTPNSAKWCHVWFHGETNKKTRFYIYENPTVTATAGTPITCYNRNRNHSTGCVAKLYGGASATSQGATLIGEWAAGSTGVAGQDIGGSRRAENEIILKQNEDYLVRFETQDADASVTVLLDWYEHTDR